MKFIKELPGKVLDSFCSLLVPETTEEKMSFGDEAVSLCEGMEGYGRVLRSVSLPNRKDARETDVIFVHEKGIFIFEGHSCTGNISGGIDVEKWEQRLPDGCNLIFSPVIESDIHCDALAAFLGIDRTEITSYVVFPDSCTLNITDSCGCIYRILQRKNLAKTLKNEMKKREEVLTESEVDEVYNRLSGEGKGSFFVGRVIREARTGNKALFCPVCGGMLRMRNNAFGTFYGCENYPECNYIRKYKE